MPLAKTRMEIVIQGFGTVIITPWAMDYAMNKYLPNSVKGLRNLLCEREPDFDWSETRSISEMLAILADWDCNVDNNPLRAY